MPQWDAIVLAGGRARRLGGIDKPGLTVDGRTLLQAAVEACAGARETVVVGPRRHMSTPVTWALEDPAGGGPVAAVAAGVDVLNPDADVVVLLAADLPAVSASLVERLVAAGAAADTDGAVAVDADGRSQPLLAAYRRAALVHALSELDPPGGRSMRELIAGLALVTVPAGPATADIDTPDDLRRWQSRRQNGDQTWTPG